MKKNVVQMDNKQLFEKDNFESRRSTGNNMYDPESLLTGAEIERGLTYYDKRVWTSPEVERLAIEGKMPIALIPTIAPRRKAAQ